MQLSEDLVFLSSGVPSIDTEIPEDPAHDKVTVCLKGVLTKTTAAALKVDWIFASETVAFGGLRDGNLSKDTNLTDVELRLFHEDGTLESCYPDKAHSWKISAIGGGGWAAQCKIDVGGNGDAILDFFRNHRLGFQWTLRPRQANLFDGGDRVEMKAAPDAGTDDGENKDAPDAELSLFDGVFSEESPSNEPCETCGGVGHHTAECFTNAGSLASAAAMGEGRKRGRPPGAKNKPKETPELEPVA